MRDANNQLQQKDIDYLAKEVAEVKNTMTVGFTAIHTKLDVFNENYVKRVELNSILSARDEKLENITENLQKELEGVKDNQTWVVRSIIGIVITAVLGFLIANQTGII